MATGVRATSYALLKAVRALRAGLTGEGAQFVMTKKWALSEGRWQVEQSSVIGAGQAVVEQRGDLVTVQLAAFNGS